MVDIVLMSNEDGDFIFRLPDLLVRICGHRSGAGPIGVEKSSNSGDFKSGMRIMSGDLLV